LWNGKKQIGFVRDRRFHEKLLPSRAQGHLVGRRHAGAVGPVSGGDCPFAAVREGKGTRVCGNPARNFEGHPLASLRRPARRRRHRQPLRRHQVHDLPAPPRTRPPLSGTAQARCFAGVRSRATVSRDSSDFPDNVSRWRRRRERRYQWREVHPRSGGPAAREPAFYCDTVAPLVKRVDLDDGISFSSAVFDRLSVNRRETARVVSRRDR